MPQLRWKLFDLFGIPVMIDLTFGIILLMFVNSGSSFPIGLAMALILAISIIAHEFGHALSGRVFGCETKTITLSLIGGCASMVSMPRKGWQEFMVAFAGPLVSFALSFGGVIWLACLAVDGGISDALGFVCAEVLSSFGIHCSFSGTLMVSASTSEFLLSCALYLTVMNAFLGCFNLLPGFPMDGGRIFRSFMMLFLSRPKATYVAMVVGRVFAVLLALSGLYSLFNGGSWAWIRIFIAWMIWQDGYREYQLALMESSWRYSDFRARVSPPPYGGDGDECDVSKDK